MWTYFVIFSGVLLWLISVFNYLWLENLWFWSSDLVETFMAQHMVHWHWHRALMLQGHRPRHGPSPTMAWGNIAGYSQQAVPLHACISSSVSLCAHHSASLSLLSLTTYLFILVPSPSQQGLSLLCSASIMLGGTGPGKSFIYFFIGFSFLSSLHGRILVFPNI